MTKKHEPYPFCGRIRQRLTEQYGCLALCIIANVIGFYMLTTIWEWLSK